MLVYLFSVEVKAKKRKKIIEGNLDFAVDKCETEHEARRQLLDYFLSKKIQVKKIKLIQEIEPEEIYET